MNLGHWLERMAKAEATRPALYCGTEQVADYASFAARAARVAGWLAAQGVAPGDRVALYRLNDPEWLILFYGIWYAGAVAVPINAKLHGREAAWIIGDAEVSVTFAAGAQAEGLRVAGITCEDRVPEGPALGPVARAGDDLAWLFYTSGTTGRPKGVMITHAMLMAMALSYFADVDQVTPEDTALYAAPLSHGAGIYNLMHVLRGARHVCPSSQGFDPAEIFELAAHHGRVHMFAAPTMVTRLTAFGEGPVEGLRTIVYAGGPMYLEDILAARARFGDVFVQIYGQGECPMAITALPRADVMGDDMARLASVGRAQSCVELRVDAPPGAAGEVLVRGAAVMPGYWRNPQATADTIREGWLHTGDVGVMDAAGYLTLQDRAKDLIITGGSNVYPREVEEALLRAEGVQEVAVVGRRHPDWGEEVVAFVVGTAEAPALDAFCRDQIARFKAPKDYIFVPALPKNAYGKVLKTDLRAWAAGGPDGLPPAAEPSR
ncbi:MAG: AMP-binding protein [Pseudomonadota bacterium]